MKINNFKCISLFDGISACQQAFKNLGIEFDGVKNTYYASEIDKYAIQVTQKNFPNTVQLGDVKNIKCTPNSQDETHIYMDADGLDKTRWFWKGETFDLLCAGFPCQDLSIAKKDGKGLDGERSGLFYELLRIIKEVKPKNILIENVSSMKKEWKEKISQELGFGFTEINSSLLTAQTRKRLYWVGELQPNGTYKKVDIEQPQDKGILLKDILEKNVSDDFRIKTDRGHDYLQKISFKGCKTEQRLEPNLNGKTNCLTTVSKDNLVLESSYLSKKNVENLLQYSKDYEPIGKAPTLTTELSHGTGYNVVPKMMREIFYAETGLNLDKTIRVGHFNKGGQGDRIYSVEGKSVCLSANGSGRGAKTGLYKIDLPDGEYHVRKLTVNECCRLQGFPVNFCDNVSKSQGYKALGNSFTVPVIEHLLINILKNKKNSC